MAIVRDEIVVFDRDAQAALREIPTGVSVITDCGAHDCKTEHVAGKVMSLQMRGGKVVAGVEISSLMGIKPSEAGCTLAPVRTRKDGGFVVTSLQLVMNDADEDEAKKRKAMH